MNLELAAEKPIIVGLGATGLSCAEYFAREEIAFQVLDTRENPPCLNQFRSLFPAMQVELGNLDEQMLLDSDCLVVSPGVSLKTPEIARAIAAGKPVCGDIELFVKAVQSPVVGITGSNGKSTVVAMVAEILRAAAIDFGLGGNLDGINFKPALDLLKEPLHDLYLLELSSFQLETTHSLAAEVAVLLNISEDHLDRYDSLDDYAQAKRRVFHGCRKAVINLDDPNCRLPEGAAPEVFGFSYGQPVANGVGILQDHEELFIAHRFEKIIAVHELKVVGQHNSLNALAATATALALGIEPAVIRAGLKGFEGLPHRCQWVSMKQGVEYFNDSKGTNVGATSAAIEGVGQRVAGHVVLIAGGQAKGADFSQLMPAMNKWGKAAVLLGQDAMEIAASLGDDIQVHFVDNMEQAVSCAAGLAEPGDAVLLSPACASFDMFENFQHRGDCFVDAVRNYL